MGLRKDTRLLIGLTIFVILIVTFLSGYFTLSSQKEKNMPVICPEDAMICPGGTSVSRSGPNCTFAPCPPETTPIGNGIIEDPLEVGKSEGAPVKGKDDDDVMCTQEVKMCSDGSYVGRSGPRCEFAPCPEDGGKNFPL